MSILGFLWRMIAVTVSLRMSVSLNPHFRELSKARSTVYPELFTGARAQINITAIRDCAFQSICFVLRQKLCIQESELRICTSLHLSETLQRDFLSEMLVECFLCWEAELFYTSGLPVTRRSISTKLFNFTWVKSRNGCGIEYKWWRGENFHSERILSYFISYRKIQVSFSTKPRSVYVYKLITLNAWALIVSAKRKNYF